MHLLVLSAFRLGDISHVRSTVYCLNAPSGAQCFPTGRIGFASSQSPDDCLNAPSGAQCFPTDEDGNLTQNPFDQVSMHLLVLSAFRRHDPRRARTPRQGLNAPSGAQCFPTGFPNRLSVEDDTGLNAPSGAQCFPT